MKRVYMNVGIYHEYNVCVYVYIYTHTYVYVYIFFHIHYFYVLFVYVYLNQKIKYFKCVNSPKLIFRHNVTQPN